MDAHWTWFFNSILHKLVASKRVGDTLAKCWAWAVASPSRAGVVLNVAVPVNSGLRTRPHASVSRSSSLMRFKAAAVFIGDIKRCLLN